MMGTTRNADLACQRAIDELARVGFDNLDEKQKTLATVWKIEAGVENEGFVHFYSSAAGDLAFYGPTAFRNIGARHMAEVFGKANTLFGPDGPPREREARVPLVRAFSHETRAALEAFYVEFVESPDNTDSLLDDYLDYSKAQK
jgi:hypothetical protein